jgi:ribosomal protein S18 acetylase RimI-like enzyme
MLTISEIRDVQTATFASLYDLYQSAFISIERRSYDGLMRELLEESQFHSLVFHKENEFVGFLNYWCFDQFWYIEHFAVEANLRNQQFGTEAMKLFLELTSLPVLFEVEMPENDFAKRRIRFYERLGFSVLSNK